MFKVWIFRRDGTLRRSNEFETRRECLSLASRDFSKGEFFLIYPAAWTLGEIIAANPGAFDQRARVA